MSVGSDGVLGWLNMPLQPVPFLGQTEQCAEACPSRKVRTSQGRVVGSADPGKPAGKCHRNDTADARDLQLQSRAGKGEMVR